MVHFTFSQKQKFEISLKLSLLGTVEQDVKLCVHEKIIKKHFNLSSAIEKSPSILNIE